MLCNITTVRLSLFESAHYYMEVVCFRDVDVFSSTMQYACLCLQWKYRMELGSKLKHILWKKIIYAFKEDHSLKVLTVPNPKLYMTVW